MNSFLCTSKKIFQQALCFFLLLSLIESCTKYNKEEMNSLENLDELGEVQITKWQVIGPFESERLNNKELNSILEYDFLELFGYQEDKITFIEFKKINKDKVTDNRLLPGNFINTRVQVDHDHINFFQCFFHITDLPEGKRSFRCAYAACLIKSPKDQEVVLLSGNSDGIKIWLNHQLILNQDIKRAVEKYQDFTVIQLKKGLNLLLVKVDTKKYFQWHFYLNLATLNLARKYYKDTHVANFLKRSILTRDDSLQLNLPLFRQVNPTYLKITANNNKVLYQEKINYTGYYCKALKELNHGIYNCKIIFPSDSFEQKFCLGNIDSLLVGYQQKFNSLNNPDLQTKITLAALLERYHILIKNFPMNRESPFSPEFLKQRIAYFDLEVSNDGKIWNKIFSGSSSSTVLHEGVHPLANTAARYLRILCHGNSVNRENKISEIRLYDGENNTVDLLFSALEASNYEENNIAQNVLDNNVSTSWSSSGNNEWIKINLGRERRLSRICIAWYKTNEEYTDIGLLDKKFIYLISELENIFDCHEKGRSFFQLPGMHIGGYYTEIDDGVQYYLVFVPESVKEGKSLPLVVAPPPFTYNILPFLKGFVIADQLFNDRLSYYANKYNYVILRMGARTHGRCNMGPIAFNDILQSIETVKKNYRIDQERIYLTGGCHDGRLSLSLATKYPSMFAAIGLYFPATDSGIRMESKWMEDWVLANDPVNFIENCSNIPIYLMHSVDDQHTSAENSFRLLKQAEKLGIYIQFEQLANITSYFLYPRDYFVPALNFFKDKVRVISPNNVLFSTSQLKYNQAYWIRITSMVPMKKASIKATIDTENRVQVFTHNVYQYELLLNLLNYDKNKAIKIITNGTMSYHEFQDKNKVVVNVDQGKGYGCSGGWEKNSGIEGPVVHAFSEQFILVAGSGGTAEDRGDQENEIMKCKNLWRSNYFGELRCKKDIEITAADIENSHLILVGNEQTNSLIKRVIDKIPLTIFPDRVIIGNRGYTGQNLNLHMVYPNPLNKNKYIVLIVSNDIHDLHFGNFDLSTTGWYDFALWEMNNNRVMLRHAGYFNNCWQVE
jgi:hypothetical protein